MSDVTPSENNATALLNAGHATTRIIVIAFASLLIVGGAVAWRLGASGATESTLAARLTQPLRNPAIDQLVENTKALETSQQQAVDQLQILQDMLTTQQTETKRASDRVALLGNKLDALQQSFASIPPPAAEEPEVQPRPKARSKTSSRSKAVRGGSRKASRAKKTRTASRK